MRFLQVTVSSEQYWNGSLLDCVEAVLGFAQTMTWQKIKQIEREEGFEKWFVQIRPLTPQNP
jgi:hypothetical protein